MTDSPLAELDRDVWLPFQAAYDHGDMDAHIALHTPDLMRVEKDSGWLGGVAGYAERIREAHRAAVAEGRTITVRFRFAERLATADLASERGVFEVVTGGSTSYGRFHTIARKEDGRWRLAVDYDSSEDGTVTAEDYAACHPVGEHGPFPAKARR